VVKQPYYKIYFVEAALAAHLTRHATAEVLMAGPMLRFETYFPEKKVKGKMLICNCKEQKKMPHGVMAIPFKEFPEWIEAVV